VVANFAVLRGRFEAEDIALEVRMRSQFLRVLFLLTTAAWAAPIPALRGQDLAQAAQREKERRAKAKSETRAKTYDESDLAAASGKSFTAVSADASLQSVSSPPATSHGSGTNLDTTTAPPAGGQPDAKGEAYWRARALAARTALSQAEASVEHLEAQQGSGAFLSECANVPGRPALIIGSGGAGTSPETNPVCAASRGIDAQVKQAKAQVVSARKGLADFEDEARRAGALPGWLR
jgi:hypothetical protein